MHIYGIQKDSTDEPVFKAAMEMQTREKTCVYKGEEEGEMNKEQHENIYSTICKISIQWEFAV